MPLICNACHSGQNLAASELTELETFIDGILGALSKHPHADSSDPEVLNPLGQLFILLHSRRCCFERNPALTAKVESSWSDVWLWIKWIHDRYLSSSGRQPDVSDTFTKRLESLVFTTTPVLMFYLDTTESSLEIGKTPGLFSLAVDLWENGWGLPAHPMPADPELINLVWWLVQFGRNLVVPKYATSRSASQSEAAIAEATDDFLNLLAPRLSQNPQVTGIALVSSLNAILDAFERNMVDEQSLMHILEIAAHIFLIRHPGIFHHARLQGLADSLSRAFEVLVKLLPGEKASLPMIKEADGVLYALGYLCSTASVCLMSFNHRTWTIDIVKAGLLRSILNMHHLAKWSRECAEYRNVVAMIEDVELLITTLTRQLVFRSVGRAIQDSIGEPKVIWKTWKPAVPFYNEYTSMLKIYAIFEAKGSDCNTGCLRIGVSGLWLR